MARALPVTSVLLFVLGIAASSRAEPADSGGPEPAEDEHEGRLALAQAERPLTLPRFILSPELDFDITRLPHYGELAGQSFANLSVGVGFGLTDYLTVRAVVLPLQLAGPPGTGFHYGQLTEALGPGIGATLRFLKGPVELGVSFDVSIITAQGLSGVALQPGVPVRAHLGRRVRLDTGVFLPATFESAPATLQGGDAVGAPSTGPNIAPVSAIGVSIPVSVLFDITEPLHVGIATGFAMDDVRVAESKRIPLGLFAGYAIEGNDGPILDIDPFVTFPGLLTPGGSGPIRDDGQPSWYTFGLRVGGFLYL